LSIIKKDQKLLEIYSNFIKDDSMNQLNISSKHKNLIESMIKNDIVVNDSFEEIIDLIFDDVKTNILDTFSRFSTSKYYINMIKTFSKNLTIQS
jgi:hypothetical protein